MYNSTNTLLFAKIPWIVGMFCLFCVGHFFGVKKKTGKFVQTHFFLSYGCFRLVCDFLTNPPEWSFRVTCFAMKKNEKRSFLFSNADSFRCHVCFGDTKLYVWNRKQLHTCSVVLHYYETRQQACFFVQARICVHHFADAPTYFVRRHGFNKSSFFHPQKPDMKLFPMY